MWGSFRLAPIIAIIVDDRLNDLISCNQEYYNNISESIIYLVIYVDRIIIVTVLVPVVSIVFVLATVVLSLLIVKKRCGVFNSASTSKLSKQLSISHHLKDSSIHPPALEVIVHSSSSQESGKLLGSSGQESHIFTPTSVESTTPLFKDHSGLSQGIAYHNYCNIIHVYLPVKQKAAFASICIDQCQYMIVVLKL